MAFRTLNRFFESLGTANHYAHLFSMSDRELAARGFDREGLTRSYLSSLGGR